MLSRHNNLIVSQQVEPLQVVTGLETQNRYRVTDNEGEPLLFAHEESGFVKRQLLGSHRPLTLNVVDAEGSLRMVARRNHFWFFSHLELLYPDGSPIGRMERRLSFIGRRFELLENQGHAAMVHGPMMRPNTFWVRQHGREIGKITKEWGGLARELVSVADSFQVEFDSALPEPLRWLIVGAAFSIDMDFFESRNRWPGGIRPGTLGGHSFDTGGFMGRGI